MSEQSRAIVKAIESNDLPTVVSLCSTHRVALQASGELQYLLDYTAGANRPDVLDVLIPYGADVNAPLDEYTNQGVLYTAAACGATDSVRWLLGHGVTVNTVERGEVRCLPLFVAIRCGHREIVELLVKNGAVTNTAWNGESPVDCAIRLGHKQIAEYLQTVAGSSP